MANDIICKNCGGVNDYRIEKKANNQCAFCNGCEAFIKNIPYAPNTIIYFGKYKGKDINELTDVPYMEWMYQNVDRLKEHQKQALNNRINLLKNQGR